MKWFMSLEIFWRIVIFSVLYIWLVIGVFILIAPDHFGIFMGLMGTCIAGFLGGFKLIGVEM